MSLVGHILEKVCVEPVVFPSGHWEPLLIHNRWIKMELPQPFLGKLLFSSSFVSKYPLPFISSSSSFYVWRDWPMRPSLGSLRIHQYISWSVFFCFFLQTWFCLKWMSLPSPAAQRSLCNDINGPLNLVSSVLFISTIFANNCMLFWGYIYNPGPLLNNLNYSAFISLPYPLPSLCPLISFPFLSNPYHLMCLLREPLSALHPYNWAQLSGEWLHIG